MISDYINCSNENGNWLIHLNRPLVLNAFSTEMITDLDSSIINATLNNAKNVYILSALPNAFCAGGDMKAIYNYCINENYAAAKLYFEIAYSAVEKIARSITSIISVVDGLCMGGGMGIAFHSGQCYFTRQAVFAMPEVKIGFFPDVAIINVFKKLPLGWAHFYLFTGLPLAHEHVVKYGLAHLIDAERYHGLDLFNEPINSLPHLEAIKCPYPDWIEPMFRNNIKNIIIELNNSNDAMAKSIALILNNVSPISLLVISKLVKLSANLTLNQQVMLEKRLASKMIYLLDCKSGIKNVLIDKQKLSNWEFKNVNEVPENLIDALFLPVFEDQTAA